MENKQKKIKGEKTRLKVSSLLAEVMQELC